MMTKDDEWLRAFEIYTTKGRRGFLPIKRTGFYAMLNRGDFPKPDSDLAGIKLWRRSSIEKFLDQRKAA